MIESAMVYTGLLVLIGVFLLKLINISNIVTKKSDWLYSPIHIFSTLGLALMFFLIIFASFSGVMLHEDTHEIVDGVDVINVTSQSNDYIIFSIYLNLSRFFLGFIVILSLAEIFLLTTKKEILPFTPAEF